MRRTTILVAIATPAITAVVVGGVTVAVAGGDDDIIRGCVNRESRLLRVTNSPCKSFENALSWNAEGEEGDRGPRGPKGDPVLLAYLARPAWEQGPAVSPGMRS
jgi:hypothetical protein